MSRLSIFDRLTGQQVPTPGNILASTRFIYISDDELVVNNVIIKRGDFILPTQGDRIIIENSAEENIVIEDIQFNQFPDRDERNSILAIGQNLQSLEEDDRSWTDWLKVSPLVVGSLDRMHLTLFERALQKYGWHLKQVCSKPKTQLTSEIERLPISQARRIPTKAYSHLATHTEDWEYPKLSSVIPRKILSTFPTDLYDFYENRVAARLAREVYVYLSGRRTEVEELEKWKGELELGIPRRQHRIYSLLSEAVSVEGMQKSAEHTREILGLLYEQTLSLFDSPLYKAVPGPSREGIPTSVRATNILVHDRHYRYVNLLWREYLERGRDKPKSHAQVQKELQNYCKAFDRYVALLIFRGLDQLGYAPIQDKEIKQGVTLNLDGPWNCVECKWDENGVIIIKVDETTFFRIVPVASALIGCSDVNQISANLDQIYQHFRDQIKPGRKVSTQALGNKPTHTIVVYPGSSRERYSLPTRLQRLACSNGTDLSQPLPIGVLPVRSYELGSLERVARALRWMLLGNFILSYPPKVPVPVKYQSKFLEIADWLQQSSDPGFLSVINIPKDREIIRMNDTIRDIRGELVRQGQKVHQMDIDRVNNFFDSIQSAFKGITKIRTCPVCGKETRSENFHPGENDNFVCSCGEHDCEAIWGTRQCGNCGKSYPFLSVKNNSNNDGDLITDWVDRIYGMDILATPCPSESNSNAFICPFCGDCGRQRTTDEICRQCRSFQVIDHSEGSK